MNKANILGLSFDNVTLPGAVDIAMEQIETAQKGYVVTPNAEIAYLCCYDEELRDIVNGASLVLPDGIGIIYAAKILGQALSGKVAGVDFADALLARMAEAGKSVFFLGAAPGIAQKASDKVREKYPGLIVKGVQDGYFASPQEAIDAVNACGGADVLYVCLGAPKQEAFMKAHLSEMNATLLCGLGGTLDVLAGEVQRAPDIFIKLGLEWFYRLLKQPSRIGRMMRLPKYMMLVLKEKIWNKNA